MWKSSEAVFDHLTIYDRRERLVVGLADAVLRAGVAVGRLRPRRAAVDPPGRILLLRLERIGDLLMTIAAIREVRRRAPDAHIDLAVGGWNEPLAALIEQVDRIETVDAPWLVRDARKRPASEWLRRAWVWRRRRYDLAINFEGDIRSNALIWLSGAKRRVGFAMAGGGPLLTDAVPHDAARHTAENAVRLVDRAFPRTEGTAAQVTSSEGPHRLRLPDDARVRAAEQLKGTGTGRLIGVHASGGRAIKQWDPGGFAAVARHLARRHDAAVVLTGLPADRPLVAEIAAALRGEVPVVEVVGAHDVVTLAAVLERLLILVTADTGPMHLAAAVGTPVVAVFGPSDPARYAPLIDASRVVRIDLACSPCNRIRKPPRRCQGHVPDCLHGVTPERVMAAADELLSSVLAQERVDH